MFRSPNDISSDSEYHDTELLSDSASASASASKHDDAVQPQASSGTSSIARSNSVANFETASLSSYEAALQAVALETVVTAANVPANIRPLVLQRFTEILAGMGVIKPEVVRASRPEREGQRAQYQVAMGQVLGRAWGDVAGAIDSPAGSEMVRSVPGSPTGKRPGLTRASTDIARHAARIPVGLQRSSSRDVHPPVQPFATFSRTPSMLRMDDPVPLLQSRGIMVRSRYRTDYNELGLLGKGGFGKVFKVQAKLDKQYYACKMVVLKPELFNATPRNMERWNAVVKEIEILAVMDHPNIVRYHGSWIEDDDFYLAPQETNEPAVCKIFEEVRLDDESSLFERSKPGDGSLDICFEDSNATSKSKGSEKKTPPKSKAKVAFDLDPSSSGSEGSSFAPEPSASHQDSTTASGSASYDSDDASASEPSISTALIRSGPPTPRPRDPVLKLHILMAVYPLTLSKFLGRDHAEPSTPRHCFCLSAALALFLGICTGVDHLHQQQIVHRDLKPANVFLAPAPARPACCAAAPATAFTPRIGDFGLVAEMHRFGGDEPAAPAASATKAKIVGTQLYRAPEGGTAADVDVWALAVVLVELLVPFASAHERYDVLGRLTADGAVPRDVARWGADVVELVQGCACRDPRTRWPLGRVMRTAARLLARARRTDDDDAAVLGRR